MAEQEIERILVECNSEDLYGILNVSSGASAVELKRSYRRIALLVHPDKCSADRGSEAFKLVNDAYSILSDDAKRQLYDRHGITGISSSASASTRQESSGFRRRRGPVDMDELSPEELFEMFFGGGTTGRFGTPRFQFGAANRRPFGFDSTEIPRSTRTRRRPSPQAEPAAQTQFLTPMLIQLLPLIFIMFSMLFSSMMHRDPSYSFSATPGLSERKETYRFNIPFFLSPQDYQTHSSKDFYYQKSFEDKVESVYITNLQNSCRGEMETKNARISKARWWGTAANVDEANSITTPSCDALYELRKRASQL